MKNKLIYCLIMCSATVIFADENNNLSSLLKETIQQLPERARSPESIAERRATSLSQLESFSKIQILVSSSWERDLPKIKEFAENESEKTIYFKAAQTLSRSDYIRFLTAATSLVANDLISKQQLKWSIFPGEKHLREMWIENPPSASLKNLAYQAGLVFPDDKNMKDFFGKVIAGQVAIDSSGKDEKSLGATPTVSQNPLVEVQRPDRRASEFPTAGTPMPNERVLDSSAAGSFVQKIGAGRILTFAGFIGIIIAATLFWHWKSKPTP